MIKLKDRVLGNIYTEDGDDRVFKVVEHENFRFYVYALQREQRKDVPTRWRLDYEETKRLIKNFNLVVEYSKITHTPTDNIYLPQAVRKEVGCFRQVGIRYIAEASIRQGTSSIVRTGSAGSDNVSASFMTWAPDIACKRATIKCVLDVLSIKGTEPEIVPMEKIPMDSKAAGDVVEEFKPADKNQVAAIKALLKKKKKKLPEVAASLGIKIATYPDLWDKAAELIIEELQK